MVKFKRGLDLKKSVAVEPIGGCGKVVPKFKFYQSDYDLPQTSSQGGDY